MAKSKEGFPAKEWLAGLGPLTKVVDKSRFQFRSEVRMLIAFVLTALVWTNKEKPVKVGL